MRAIPSLKQTLVYSGLALIIVVAALAFDNKQNETFARTVPFLTGAANLSWGEGWLYSEDEVARVSALPSRDAKYSFRAERLPREELAPYNYSNKGLMYVVWVARTLFFWLGDLQAVECLQIAVHILATFLLMSRFKSIFNKSLFFLIFAPNPMIMYGATLPFYYYWQAIPGVAIAFYLLDRNFRFGWYSLAMAVLLASMYVIRPTVLLVCLLLFVLVMFRESKLIGAASIALFFFFAVVVFQGNDFRKEPWHSVMVGIGGYPNPYNLYMHDYAAYDYYQERTGIEITFQPDLPNYLRAPGVREKYSAFMKQEYFGILKENPMMLLRNAVLNVCQSFSIGYFIDARAGISGMTLSYISAAVGFLYFAALALRRKTLFILAIGLSSGAFTPYNPPVPIYLYGSYVVLLAAFVELVNDFPIVRKWSLALEEKLSLA